MAAGPLTSSLDAPTSGFPGGPRNAWLNHILAEQRSVWKARQYVTSDVGVSASGKRPHSHEASTRLAFLQVRSMRPRLPKDASCLAAIPFPARNFFRTSVSTRHRRTLRPKIRHLPNGSAGRLRLVWTHRPTALPGGTMNAQLSNISARRPQTERPIGGAR